MTNKKWSELSGTQKGLLLTLVSVELSLTATAMVDLVRRPPDQVHGRKGLWAMALFVQPVGPIVYLLKHR